MVGALGWVDIETGVAVNKPLKGRFKCSMTLKDVEEYLGRPVDK